MSGSPEDKRDKIRTKLHGWRRGFKACERCKKPIESRGFAKYHDACRPIADCVGCRTPIFREDPTPRVFRGNHYCLQGACQRKFTEKQQAHEAALRLKHAADLRKGDLHTAIRAASEGQKVLFYPLVKEEIHGSIVDSKNGRRVSSMLTQFGAGQLCMVPPNTELAALSKTEVQAKYKDWVVWNHPEDTEADDGGPEEPA